MEDRSGSQKLQGIEGSGDMFYCFDKGCDFNQSSTTLDKIIPHLSSGGDTEWVQYSAGYCV